MHDAYSFVLQALKVGRVISFAPCVGLALVVLGQLRITQAIQIQNNHHIPAETAKRLRNSTIGLILRAKTSLQRTLALDGLEAETRTEGQLTLAQAAFLLGEIDSAWQQILQVMREAKKYDQIWLLACAQRLLGNILATRDQHEEAAKHFRQSLQILEERGMRLEWARTLRDYNETILRQAHSDNGDFEQAIFHLQEARKVFEECGAALDLELVDRSLAAYASPVEAAAHKHDK